MFDFIFFFFSFDFEEIERSSPAADFDTFFFLEVVAALPPFLADAVVV